MFYVNSVIDCSSLPMYVHPLEKHPNGDALFVHHLHQILISARQRQLSRLNLLLHPVRRQYVAQCLLSKSHNQVNKLDMRAYVSNHKCMHKYPRI